MARCNDENSHPWAVRRRITHSSSAAPVCCAKLFCPCPAIRPDSFADCRGDRLREQLLWARRRPVQPERAAGERRHWGVDLGRRTTLQRHSPRFSRSRKVVAGHRLGRQDVPCPALPSVVGAGSGRCCTALAALNRAWVSRAKSLRGGVMIAAAQPGLSRASAGTVPALVLTGAGRIDAWPSAP